MFRTASHTDLTPGGVFYRTAHSYTPYLYNATDIDADVLCATTHATWPQPPEDINIPLSELRDGWLAIYDPTSGVPDGPLLTEDEPLLERQYSEEIRMLRAAADHLRHARRLEGRPARDHTSAAEAHATHTALASQLTQAAQTCLRRHISFPNIPPTQLTAWAELVVYAYAETPEDD